MGVEKLSTRELYASRFGNENLLQKKNEMWNVLCRHYFQADIPMSSSILDVGGGGIVNL